MSFYFRLLELRCSRNSNTRYNPIDIFWKDFQLIRFTFYIIASFYCCLFNSPQNKKHLHIRMWFIFYLIWIHLSYRIRVIYMCSVRAFVNISVVYFNFFSHCRKNRLSKCATKWIKLESMLIYWLLGLWQFHLYYQFVTILLKMKVFFLFGLCHHCILCLVTVINLSSHYNEMSIHKTRIDWSQLIASRFLWFYSLFIYCACVYIYLSFVMVFVFFYWFYQKDKYIPGSERKRCSYMVYMLYLFCSYE